jgi:hypothetical protein
MMFVDKIKIIVAIIVFTGIIEKEYYPYGQIPEKYFNKGSFGDKGKRYKSLAPLQGDYSRLKYVIKPYRPDVETNKKPECNMNKLEETKDMILYLPGDPVYIKTYIRNESDTEVSITCIGGYDFWALNIIHIQYLIDSEETLFGNVEKKLGTKWDNVRLTLLGQKKEEEIESIQRLYMGIHDENILLKPNKEIAILPICVPVNIYYDMTRPGIYRITLERKSVAYGQKYNSPLKSNTIYVIVGSPNCVIDWSLEDEFQ